MTKRITENGIEVIHAETGAIGIVIDFVDGYRPRVQWPTGRITRTAVDDLRLYEREIRLPTELQKFKYYLHDNYNSFELREYMEGQGVILSDIAWARIERPFYEVTLNCTVDADGHVEIESVS